MHFVLTVVGRNLTGRFRGRLLGRLGRSLIGRLGRGLRLLLLAGLVYSLGNARIALWDRDEPRFAQASREMIHRQDYIVPHFNGHYRFDKPVLVYWLMVVNYRIFGAVDFAARFASGISGVLACGLLYSFAARLFNRRIAISAAAMAFSCSFFAIYSADNTIWAT